LTVQNRLSLFAARILALADGPLDLADFFLRLALQFQASGLGGLPGDFLDLALGDVTRAATLVDGASFHGGDLENVGERRLLRGVLNFVAGLFDIFADAFGRVTAGGESGPKGADEEQGKQFILHGVWSFSAARYTYLTRGSAVCAPVHVKIGIARIESCAWNAGQPLELNPISKQAS
jgi:hypothetical protein